MTRGKRRKKRSKRARNKRGDHMRQYVLDVMLRPVAQSPLKKDEGGKMRLILLSGEEFLQIEPSLPHKKSVAHTLEHMDYCRAQMFGACIVGAMCIPVGKRDAAHKRRFAFYIGDSVLYLIGQEEGLEPLVGRMRENQFLPDVTPAGFFCSLLNAWIDEEALALQRLEEALEQLEDGLLADAQADFYGNLMHLRRELMVKYSYYYQLVSMAGTMGANTNNLLRQEDCMAFENFSGRAERLRGHAATLREYHMQLRDMYQTRISIKQGKAMNLLTVLSAIFLPLTLLAGWYGMNFRYMPELSWQFGYPLALVVSVVIVVVEIIVFKKKGLL